MQEQPINEFDPVTLEMISYLNDSLDQYKQWLLDVDCTKPEYPVHQGRAQVIADLLVVDYERVVGRYTEDQSEEL